MISTDLIRPAVDSDYDFINQLWRANKDTMGTVFTIREYITKGTMFIIPNTGFIALDIPHTKPIVHISMIAVSPNSRGGGYGKALIEYVKLHYPGKSLVLDARVGAPNNKFYEKLGFVTDHTIKSLKDFDVYTYTLKQKFTFESFF